MGVATILNAAGLVLRILHEAPELLNAMESFWTHIAGNPGAPPHVEAAVQAAFHKLREGEVG